eukprot:CAMPEP_0169115650 /NCGR_PEP_ID=MMETSP1015-20121227/29452_1 /TAXON_ID=342587 /ORGANISM="Karlodinium micrum, Strain CCMP2283" /LENGTH=129 /DNA_ID=CAMNT_0009178109 /DNA_START=69 /DNA_END=458 /DNA_ORIENTATION=-
MSQSCGPKDSSHERKLPESMRDAFILSGDENDSELSSEDGGSQLPESMRTAESMRDAFILSGDESDSELSSDDGGSQLPESMRTAFLLDSDDGSLHGVSLRMEEYTPPLLHLGLKCMEHSVRLESKTKT